jgi:uncharacterized protein YqjF (DUF2071 family)
VRGRLANALRVVNLPLASYLLPLTSSPLTSHLYLATMRPLLTATWQNLVMVNYQADAGLLARYVPRGTELDTWGGTTYLSIVGFQFRETRVRGVAIPRHGNFEEINLRFYVRRVLPEGVRRGVVFIREVVPRRAIAFGARFLYHEPYTALPTRSRIVQPLPDGAGRFEYGWRGPSGWMTLAATVFGVPRDPGEGSLEEFISEHYWGYNRQPDGGTMEYQVQHPRWEVWPAESVELSSAVPGFYGPALASCLECKPLSAFVAAGSAVTVHQGHRLTSV